LLTEIYSPNEKKKKTTEAKLSGISKFFFWSVNQIFSIMDCWWLSQKQIRVIRAFTKEENDVFFNFCTSTGKSFIKISIKK
jgi:hypothetical protein